MTKLSDYEILCKIKPKSLKTRYPYTTMTDEQIIKTLNRIELVYQHLTPQLIEKSKIVKSGGGLNSITVITC
jgi:hypothetical protein